MIQWRTIDSAPKDGTAIMIWAGGRLYDAKWHEDAYRPDNEPGCWRARWAEIDSYGVEIEEPATHWAPIEAPGVVGEEAYRSANIGPQPGEPDFEAT